MLARSTVLARTLFTALIGVCAACSDDGTEAEAPVANLGEGDYALAVTVFGDDGETGYVSLVEDPAREVEVTTERALEVGGSVSLFGVQGRRAFGLGSTDAPTLIRYEIDPDGNLEQTARMSLGNEGIESGFMRPELVPLISERKAYWLAEPVVVWDPQEMVVSGTFSLADAERDDYELELGEALLRDEYLFVTASYRDDEDDGEAGIAAVLVIDTRTDELVETLTDERCGSTTHILEDDGDLYVTSSVLAATFHAHGTEGYPAPCMLRIPAGEQRFDPDFHIDLAGLTDGRDAGHLVRGEGRDAFILALHTDLLDEEIGPNTELWAPYEASAWRWWRIELGSDAPGSVLEDVEPGSAAVQVLSAGGRDYIALANIEEGSSILLTPDAAGELKPGLRMGGLPYGLIKLE